MNRWSNLIAVALLSVWIGVYAQSNSLLNKPLKIVVGFPPGGSADTVARALAQQLAGLAPAVIVDNKPGAGGRIALETLRNSEADGSTIVLTPASMMVVYPHIYKKLSYDPVQDFAPIARVAAAPFVLAVGPMVPPEVTTMDAFLKWGKLNASKASYGSSGAGSIPHFTGVALGKTADFDWMHIAYKGAAPAMNDLLAGQVAANISVMSNALPQLQAGKLRALAISSPQRSALLPNVPTFAELGYKDAQAVEWFGLFAPAKTPPDIVFRLNQAVLAAMKTKGFQDAIQKGSFELAPAETSSSFGVALRADLSHWGQVVKASGFTPED
jgi:tripartite-type tricarboxylate transporter receptor subunit TctC